MLYADSLFARIRDLGRALWRARREAAALREENRHLKAMLARSLVEPEVRLDE